MDDEHFDQDGVPYSYSSAASVTQFLTLVDEPHRLIRFVDALKERGFQIFETQMCGPVFLDTSYSTLDPKNSYSFRRKVALEVEKLLLVSTDNEATTAKTEREIQGGKSHVSKGTASVLQQVKKDKDSGVPSFEANPLDADVMTSSMSPTSTFQLHKMSGVASLPTGCDCMLASHSSCTLVRPRT